MLKASARQVKDASHDMSVKLLSLVAFGYEPLLVSSSDVVICCMVVVSNIMFETRYYVWGW
jgi:hypothetical protein